MTFIINVSTVQIVKLSNPDSEICTAWHVVDNLLRNSSAEFSLQAGYRAEIGVEMHAWNKKQIISGNSATKPSRGWGNRKIKLILFYFSLHTQNITS